MLLSARWAAVFCTALLLLLLGADRAETGEDRPHLAMLGPGESLRIDFASTGCFHAFRHELLVTGGTKMTLKTRPLTHEGGVADNAVWREIPLTNRDAVRLQGLIKHYRTMTPDGGCTTVDEIQLTWNIDGRVIEESFEDGSCATGDTTGRVTISTLLDQ